jgi:hypothetical protein
MAFRAASNNSFLGVLAAAADSAGSTLAVVVVVAVVVAGVDTTVEEVAVSLSSVMVDVVEGFLISNLFPFLS